MTPAREQGDCMESLTADARNMKDRAALHNRPGTLTGDSPALGAEPSPDSWEQDAERWDGMS